MQGGPARAQPARVKSSDRTLAILELLTEHPEGLTLTEIQHELSLPKSSTYTLLTTMAARGFLEQDARRRFHVGIRLWQAGQAYVAATDFEKLAMPFMQAVRDELNETVQLATLDGVDNVYIGKVDSDQALRLESRVGIRLPAYATGLGKAMLSLLDDDEIRRRFADVVFEAFTPTTITSLDALLERIAVVRSRGYAEDDGEYTPGVFCVAVPIRGTSDRLAALSVSVPEVRKTGDLIARTIASLTEATESLSARLGYRPT